MTLDEYLNYTEGYITKTEEKDGKWYIYYEDGSYDIFSCDADGNYSVSYYSNTNQLNETKTGDKLGNYITKNSTGTIIEKKEILSENVYTDTFYNSDGSIQRIEEKDNSTLTGTYFYPDGRSKKIVNENNVQFTYYTYDSNNELISSEVANAETEMWITRNYEKNYMVEKVSHGNTILEYNEYWNDQLYSSKKYDYNENGRIKRIFETTHYGLFDGEKQYIYDDNGKYIVTSDYYKDGKVFAHFTDDVLDVNYISETDTLEFYNNNGMFLSIDKDGNKTYSYNDYYDEYKYQLFLNTDGTYSTSNSENLKGTYSIDDDGNIICTDLNNNLYKYDSFGQLVKKEVDGVLYEYDNSKKSEKKTINGKTTYSLQNHIEYDEEAYETIMKGMVNICDSYPGQINSECNSVVSQVNSLYDKYSTGGIESVNSSVQNIITTINDVKESINYSLLAYSTCDKHMEEKTHSLIDSLFDESETTLARVFKNSINSSIEDVDNDKILEYKENTNFNKLYKSALPLDEVIDENGNKWYYNLKEELVGVTGIDPKINYGGEEFNVEVTENGVIKLIDKNGEPLNIYGDYNIPSGQFGGDQGALSNTYILLNDDNINNVLDKYFDNGFDEDKVDFLYKMSETGCGYTAMTNIVFKEFEGREEEFYNTFGYPMYTIKKNYDGIKVDYNYEPLIVDLYCHENVVNNNYYSTTLNADGITPDLLYNNYKYLHEEYGVFDSYNIDEYNEFIKKSGFFASSDYNIYNMDGDLVFPAGGSHAMLKVGELEDGRIIVSTWGIKYICEYNGEDDFTYTEEMAT